MNNLKVTDSILGNWYLPEDWEHKMGCFCECGYALWFYPNGVEGWHDIRCPECGKVFQVYYEGDK